MLQAQNFRGENTGGGVQGVNSRIDAQRGNATVKNSGGIQVGESSGRSGVSQVISRDINCLHRGDRSILCGGDTFLESTHFGCQRGLVANGRRHTTQQGGNF